MANRDLGVHNFVILRKHDFYYILLLKIKYCMNRYYNIKNIIY